VYIVDKWQPDEHDYDVFIGSIGFEHRATHVASALRHRIRRGVAIGFPDRHEMAYNGNLSWFRDAGFDIQPNANDIAFETLMDATVADTIDRSPPAVRVLVDISSMTRTRIATAVHCGVRALATGATVDFCYAIADFSKPPITSEAVVTFGPISPEFAGWPTNPDSPMILVLGLGFEADRALGAAELLEPADCWTFRPAGVDTRYDRALQAANEGLAEVLRGPDRQIDYHVKRPFETFVTLRALIDSLIRENRYRALILPFGPKIFALSALFVQLEFPSVGVWRVSAGTFEASTDRKASGEIIGLSLRSSNSQ
jgi:hypothetical protein